MSGAGGIRTPVGVTRSELATRRDWPLCHDSMASQPGRDSRTTRARACTSHSWYCATDGTRTRDLRLDRAALFSSELRRQCGGVRTPACTVTGNRGAPVHRDSPAAQLSRTRPGWPGCYTTEWSSGDSNPVLRFARAPLLPSELQPHGREAGVEPASPCCARRGTRPRPVPILVVVCVTIVARFRGFAATAPPGWVGAGPATGPSSCCPEGFEPPRPEGHRSASPARLPLRHGVHELCALGGSRTPTRVTPHCGLSAA